MRNMTTKKILTIMLLMLFSISLIGGCNKKEKLEDSKETVTDESKLPSSEVVTDTTVGTKSEEKPTKNLPIYCLQEETLEREPIVAIIPADAVIDAEFVVNTVVDTFEERLFLIGIDSVTSQNDTVIVSFKRDMAPVADTGTSVESGILDCISMSLLDNIESCQKVIFRMEGEAYETGHMSYKIDEPYKTLNK